MRKRLVSLILIVLLLLLALSSTALALPFSDLSGTEWYYQDIENAYAKGLINGKTASEFAPDDNLTYAEAVKLAACMRQMYLFGYSYLSNGTPWYQNYVDYCMQEGVISKEYNWNAAATRAGYMEIFANALPDAALEAVNTVVDNAIPDVSMDHPQAEGIYKLYRAGILQGSDEVHNCMPGDIIRRSEVAAILVRMMDVTKRISFSMEAAAMTVQLSQTSVTLVQGEAAKIQAEVQKGTAPYIYQWYCDGKLTGQTGKILTLGKDMEPGTTKWHCVVTDAAGQTAASGNAVVVVKAKSTGQTGEEQPAGNALTITAQPQDVEAAFEESVALTVEVRGGTAPYAYQWQAKSNGSSTWRDLSGGVGSQLKLIARGSTSYRCVITDSAGAKVISNTAKLTVKH